MTVIFSFLILKEKIEPYQILCIITAFIGTLFILRPGFDAMVTFPALIGLTGGICAGLAYTMVRALGNRGMNGALIVFAFSAFSCLASLPFLILDYTPMSGKQLLFLLLAGCSAAAAQFSITTAYRYAPAREISVFDYTQILFSSLLGIIVLGEVPGLLSILGAAIIIGASVTMFLIRRQKEAA